jgi:hypothetical protein
MPQVSKSPQSIMHDTSNTKKDCILAYVISTLKYNSKGTVFTKKKISTISATSELQLLKTEIMSQ